MQGFSSCSGCGAPTKDYSGKITVSEAKSLSPFRMGLEFNAPARGGWNIVHIAMLLPESYVIFVCPAGCMRGVTLTAADMGALHRFSAVLVSEEDVLNGNREKTIIENISYLVDGMEKQPRVIHIFSGCIDHFIGTDFDLIFSTLGKKYPNIHFIQCYMTPTMRKNALPPVPIMNRQLYSLLPKTENKRKAVNIIGSNYPLPEENEMLEMFKNGGWQVRDIRWCDTFEEYESMSESMVNITINPNGLLALHSLTERLDQQEYYLPLTYDFKKIGNNLRKLSDELSLPLPDIDALEQKTDAKLREAAEIVGDRPIVIDSTMTYRPFSLAKLLVSYGFNVEAVYAESCAADEADELEWLKKHKGDMEWRYANHPSMSRRPAFAKNDISSDTLALGQQAAYYCGTKHFVNVVDSNGLYGFDGICKLAELMTDAVLNPKDTRHVIQLKGMGCKA
ncbi:MAG: nitrogenase [Oscillospiraceae bacterium]|nr:nitrogenase [Oscillospiraceae bacterium]